MGKIVIFLMLFSAAFWADDTLDRDCLSCHKAQKIPSDLVYRRYLMKYSTKPKIKIAMLEYLKNPQRSQTIMPTQFFLRFPMKDKQDLDDKTLEIDIEQYLEKFDIKKKLTLEKEQNTQLDN